MRNEPMKERRLCAKRIVGKGARQISRPCSLRARPNSKFCTHHTKRGEARHRALRASMMKRIAEFQQ